MDHDPKARFFASNDNYRQSGKNAENSELPINYGY